GRLQSLHFLRRRPGRGGGGLAIDEQEFCHDGTPDGFAYSGGGLSPASVNTMNKLQPFGHRRGKKDIDAPDTIRFWIGRHLEGEVVPDAWLKVIRKHPRSQLARSLRARQTCTGGCGVRIFL